MAGRKSRAELEYEQNGQEAPVSITETPAFKLAVQEAVSASLAPILESLAQAKGVPSVGAIPGDNDELQSFFRQMALSIAEVADQSSDRKRVPPETLAKWAAAHERMVEAIVRHKKAFDVAKENGDKKGMDEHRPHYVAIAKMWLNERFIEPFRQNPATKRPEPVQFRWSGAPNPACRPMNAAASEIFRHYADSIGLVPQEKHKVKAWMTIGGLVIDGDAPTASRRAIEDEDSAPDFSEDLDLGIPNDPRKPFINVLGTIQPPAKQGYDQIMKAG